MPEYYWPLHLGLGRVRQCPRGPGGQRLAISPGFAARVVPLGVDLYLQAAAAERAAAGQPPLPPEADDGARQQLHAFLQQLLGPMLAAVAGQDGAGGGEADEAGGDAVEDELLGEVGAMPDEEQLQRAAEQRAAQEWAAQQECKRIGLRLHWLLMARQLPVQWPALPKLDEALKCLRRAGVEAHFGEPAAALQQLAGIRSRLQPAWDAAMAAVPATAAASEAAEAAQDAAWKSKHLIQRKVAACKQSKGLAGSNAAACVQ